MSKETLGENTLRWHRAMNYLARCPRDDESAVLDEIGLINREKERIINEHKAI